MSAEKKLDENKENQDRFYANLVIEREVVADLCDNLAEFMRNPHVVSVLAVKSALRFLLNKANCGVDVLYEQYLPLVDGLYDLAVRALENISHKDAEKLFIALHALAVHARDKKEWDA